MPPAPSLRARLMRKQGETAKRLRCCSRTSSASCALAGFACAGQAEPSSSSPLRPSLRICGAWQSWPCIHRRRRRQCVLRKRQVALELRQASQFTGSNAAFRASGQDRLSEAPRAGHARMKADFYNEIGRFRKWRVSKIV